MLSTIVFLAGFIIPYVAWFFLIRRRFILSILQRGLSLFAPLLFLVTGSFLAVGAGWVNGITFALLSSAGISFYTVLQEDYWLEQLLRIEYRARHPRPGHEYEDIQLYEQSQNNMLWRLGKLKELEKLGYDVSKSRQFRIRFF